MLSALLGSLHYLLFVEVDPLADVPDEPVEPREQPLPRDGAARHHLRVARPGLDGLQPEDLRDLLEGECPLNVLLVRENQQARPGKLRGDGTWPPSCATLAVAVLVVRAAGPRDPAGTPAHRCMSDWWGYRWAPARAPSPPQGASAAPPGSRRGAGCRRCPPPTRARLRARSPGR